MSSEKDPSPEQSSKPQQHPVDVEGNLGDRRARDRPQSLVHHQDTISTKLMPLKKRPIVIEGNDASSEGTPTADSVRRSGGDEDSGGVEGSGKKESRHKGKEKCGSSSKTGSSETCKSISAAGSKEKDAVSTATARPTAGSVRRSGVVGTTKESRQKEEKKYGSGSKTGSSGRKRLKGRDGNVKEMRKVVIASDSEAEGGEEDERDPAKIALHVEKVIAQLKVAAEEDEGLNKEKKPAVNKFQKLHILTENLSKKHLQLAFLDHGVMHLLNTWLQPLPDGSKPNTILLEGILKILDDLPIDLQQDERKVQMADSGLGKTIKCISESKEESTSIKKLAKKLVEKWYARVQNRSTNIQETRSVRPVRVPSQSPSAKTPPNKGAAVKSIQDDSDLDDLLPSLGQKSSGSSSGKRAARPEPMPMDFVAKPASKINPEEFRARDKQVKPDTSRQRVEKKLNNMKKLKKQELQATKVSAEGRGMDKYV